ncbi:MAG TPA: alpha/beta hydrolase fold domain-containing protein [Candidatus Sulfopaludibacter sp.]|nr:alpha/beta hydrolase fold domain-containing protein [Candidatus Sulfopaludibacter sp.]
MAGRAEAQSDSDTSIDGDGAVEIRRKVPVPTTVSQPAQALLASGRQFAPDGWTKESAELVEKMRGVYPVKIEAATVAGVKVKVVTSLKPKAARNDRVLINLHGGGFTSDSGSLLESIPIASLTGTKVIAVEYRLAPAFPYPAAVDDSVAVYREILKTHPARNIAVYGTSAGAILTAQTAVHLRKLGVPLPSSLGFFSGSADFARSGDSRYIYSVRGFLGFKPPAGTLTSAYVAAHDPKDPLLSPIYADLKGLPPTLCMTGTRDMLLSGTCDFHRALLRAGVDAHLMVFDAMPHAHWYSFQLPESKEALEAQATFLDRHLA